jgi:hypothetical protein
MATVMATAVATAVAMGERVTEVQATAMEAKVVVLLQRQS